MSKTRLKLDDRINLQAAINKNYSLEECSVLLKKSRSTIYREIVNNSYYKQCRHPSSGKYVIYRYTAYRNYSLERRSYSVIKLG